MQWRVNCTSKLEPPHLCLCLHAVSRILPTRLRKPACLANQGFTFTSIIRHALKTLAIMLFSLPTAACANLYPKPLLLQKKKKVRSPHHISKQKPTPGPPRSNFRADLMTHRLPEFMKPQTVSSAFRIRGTWNSKEPSQGVHKIR